MFWKNSRLQSGRKQEKNTILNIEVNQEKHTGCRKWKTQHQRKGKINTRMMFLE